MGSIWHLIHRLIAIAGFRKYWVPMGLTHIVTLFTYWGRVFYKKITVTVTAKELKNIPISLTRIVAY